MLAEKSNILDTPWFFSLPTKLSRLLLPKNFLNFILWKHFQL